MGADSWENAVLADFLSDFIFHARIWGHAINLIRVRLFLELISDAYPPTLLRFELGFLQSEGALIWRVELGRWSTKHRKQQSHTLLTSNREIYTENPKREAAWWRHAFMMQRKPDLVELTRHVTCLPSRLPDTPGLHRNRQLNKFNSAILISLEDSWRLTGRTHSFQLESPRSNPENDEAHAPPRNSNKSVTRFWCIPSLRLTE